jgi:hypothetical protein
MRYKKTGPLGPGESQSAGLQQHSAQYQSLGCKDGLRLSDGLTIEVRPQAPASVWMRLGRSAGTVAPNAVSGLPVTANWVSSSPYERTFSGVVELHSNDPTIPLSRYTVRMRTDEAAYVRLLPTLNTP